MRWQKHGLLLRAPPDLPWSTSHAALPVVERLAGEGYALYFSTRDNRGRSHIARGQLAFDDPESLRLDADPVLSPGPLGAFDDSGVTTSCIVRFEGQWYLYYTGWNVGVTVPFTFFIGCATSCDGVSFERVSAAPVLERNRVDPFLTASPWVIVENGRWRMWYVSAVGWELADGAPRHRYHIRYAESADGISWERDGTVCVDFVDHSEYAISRPCVLRDGNRYRMWFSARGAAYRIGYAESEGGISWRRCDEEAGIEPSADGWDSEMQAYPLVFRHGDLELMLYNGNGYGQTGIGYATRQARVARP